jgi:hypothetical protein
MSVRWRLWTDLAYESSVISPGKYPNCPVI